MFHFRRKKQESYWFLSGGGQFEDDDECTIPGQISCEHEDGDDDDDAEPVVVAEFQTSDDPFSSLQETYTSWPSSIWEVSFDDADGEIVFSNDDDDDNNDDDAPSCNKSMETESSYSSPEYRNTYEPFHDIDELELSAIVEEEEEEEEEDETATKSFDLDVPNGCTLLGCRVGAKKEFVGLAEDDDACSGCDSNTFLIEESFDSQGPFQSQLSPLCPPKPTRHKRLRFADEEGKAMETIHFVDNHDEDDGTTLRRVLILMLLPKQKKFEFVHAQFDTESKLTVSSLLKQLPDLATDPLIKNQKYRRLCRADCGIEMINALAIQSYDLPPDEVLLAVSSGYSSQDFHRMARTLFDNEKILRAVKRTNKAAHTIHTLESKEGDFLRMFKNTQRKNREKGSHINAIGKHFEVNVSMDQDSGCTTHHHSSLSMGPQETPKHNPSNDDVVSLLNKPGSQRCGEPIDHGIVKSRKLEEVPQVQVQLSPLSDWGERVVTRLHENTSDPKQQKRINFFGKKFQQQKLSPTSVMEPPNEISERTSFFGKKVFQKLPSPRKAARPAASPREEKRIFKKSVFERLPSPRRIQSPARADTAQGEEGFLFGKKVFHRRPSPRKVDQTPGQSVGRYVLGKNMLQQKQPTTGASTPRNHGSKLTNLAKTGWGRFKTTGSRINYNSVDVKQ